ncbi:unnamed protein product [Moneuplotes crassus]|uniref:Uncharacterized protein n=1 Tax=Euplotes crassus TaxID=5936 RepID=A0AAD1U508_EUPCR|nr:unnamed protein product [Moneuplotes crassus]
MDRFFQSPNRGEDARSIPAFFESSFNSRLTSNKTLNQTKESNLSDIKAKGRAAKVYNFFKGIRQKKGAQTDKAMGRKAEGLRQSKIEVGENKAYKEIAKNCFRIFVLISSKLKTDNSHPNREGYLKSFHRLINFFKEVSHPHLAETQPGGWPQVSQILTKVAQTTSLLSEGSEVEADLSSYFTQLCPRWNRCTGLLNLDKGCKHAHDAHELREWDDPLPIGGVITKLKERISILGLILNHLSVLPFSSISS